MADKSLPEAVLRSPFTGIWDIQSAIWKKHPAMHAVGYCTCHRKRANSLKTLFLFMLAEESKNRTAHG